MADQEQQDQQQQMQSMQQWGQRAEIDRMIACVDALDASLLPCLDELELSKNDVTDFEPPLSTDFNESVMVPAEQSSAEPELHASDDLPPPPPPDHQKSAIFMEADVKKRAREFMEAAKKIQGYFVSLQREEDKPTKAETHRKEIAAMEEEMKKLEELIQKQEKVIQDWKEEVRGRLDKQNAELERV